MSANGPSFRVLPRLDDDNRFFWTGGEDGTLRFLRCQSCQQFVHPPVPVCPGCLDSELAPEPVSGRATVHSFTVNVQEWIPGSDPYVIGLVSIDEQPDVRLITNLVDCDPDDIEIGSAVEVVFEHQEDVYLPLFRPATAASAATSATTGAEGNR
jgi:uncharacterized OB-fold protein